MKFLLPLFLIMTFFKPLFASAIEIRGNQKYKRQVQACLNLLATKAPQDYALVKRYVGVISQGDRSGMWAWETPPRYEMSDTTAYHSLTWCAGTIAHDAYHSFLYQRHKGVSSKQPDYDKWAGPGAERKAIEFQVKVMKKIGASDHQINYLKSLDGHHGDVNKDGKLDKQDYKLRNW